MSFSLHKTLTLKGKKEKKKAQQNKHHIQPNNPSIWKNDYSQHSISTVVILSQKSMGFPTQEKGNNSSSFVAGSSDGPSSAHMAFRK